MKIVLLQLIALIIAIESIAQYPAVSPDKKNISGISYPSKVVRVECKGLINPPSVDLNWKPILISKNQYIEHEGPNMELIERAKEINAIKKKEFENNKLLMQEPRKRTVNPSVETNYLGNTNNGGTPLDNSIAISNSGKIVSVANTTIEYDSYSGTTTYYNNLLTFVQGVDPGITGVCDPLVYYDQDANRFIWMCQSTPLSPSNKIFVFFSQSSDPASGWWAYEFNGDPTGNGDGFDYPKMAVSTHELFISGNLFYSGGTSHQAIVFQIDKTAGYAGNSISSVYWSNILGNPFTLLPVSYGQAGSYGPGIYLLSSNSSGSNSIDFYQITNDLSLFPVMNHYSVSTANYSPAANAYQYGTSTLLNTGDCRLLSGFYLYNATTTTGTIHYVFHSDAGSGYSGINYNRLNVTSLNNQSSVFGLSGFDYCYPSVASFSKTGSDNSVMIGFGRTGSSILPEVRVVNCDHTMNWSNSTLVKSSLSYVNTFSSAVERWGDYTGISKKHNGSVPEIWMSGMFGNASNKWDTWIAQIKTGAAANLDDVESKKSYGVYPNPIITKFSIEFDLPNSDNIHIDILDAQGKNIKRLYEGNAQKGTNIFSFCNPALAAGIYYIQIMGNLYAIKNEKIIISN